MKADPLRNLTVEQIARIQRAVDASGEASEGEIVREALRLWDQREEFRAAELETLKREYARGRPAANRKSLTPWKC